MSETAWQIRNLGWLNEKELAGWEDALQRVQLAGAVLPPGSNCLIRMARHALESLHSTETGSDDAACERAAALLRAEAERLEYPRTMVPQESEKIARRQNAFRTAAHYLDPEQKQRVASSSIESTSGETPRTDSYYKQEYSLQWNGSRERDRDFARQLERELARAMKALSAAGEQIEHFEEVVQSLAKRDQ